MKITEREITLGIVTLACVVFGGTWYGTRGKVVEWKEKKKEIANLQKEIDLHEAAIRMQDDWTSDLQDLEKDLRVFDINDRSVSPELMKIINTLSDKHGLEITKTNPYNEQPTGDLFELGINCTWQGKLDSLVGFLTELQQQGVRYDVRQLNISPIGNNTGNLKGNIIIDCAFTRRRNVG